MTDEHPTCARSAHSKTRHRCDPTSVPMKRTNKAASKRADPPSVIKRALERAKKKKAEKAQTDGTHGAASPIVPTSPPPKKTKLTSSKASGVTPKVADVNSSSDDPCVTTPAQAVSSSTTNSHAQNTSVSVADNKRSNEDRKCNHNDASVSTSRRATSDIDINSDAVDYGSSDNDAHIEQHPADDVTESVNANTISVDSYHQRRTATQGSRDKAKPASAVLSLKCLPCPLASPRTA